MRKPDTHIALNVTQPQSIPILYSFRRCPYAMRARMAIVSARSCVELREIELRDKPDELLAVSPKATVPVLVLTDGKVIDESLDIMHWALQRNDPDAWLPRHGPRTAELIAINDDEFKHNLDRYKYADRYPEMPPAIYRARCESFVAELEAWLSQVSFLAGSTFGFADAAIAPFIRQFAAVDSLWFETAPYPKVHDWQQRFLQSTLFQQAMQNYARWMPGANPLFFLA
ncbi:MAG: glutathione S-transferase [Methylomonas sp.]|nr:glutathione S-transferase [Methylomonas sp.]